MSVSETKENKPRLFQLIRHSGVPVAARFLTVNTEPYSTLNDTSILLFIRQGQLKLDNGGISQTYHTGECILLLQYSDFKAKRILDRNSDIFEALAFVFPELGTDRFKPEKDSAPFKETAPLKFTTKSLSEFFEKLSNEFSKGKKVDTQKVDALRKVVLSNVQMNHEKFIRDYFSSSKHRLASFLFRNLTTNITLEELAQKYGVSTSGFYRTLVKEMGLSPHQWIKDQRLHYARCEMQFRQKKAAEMYLELGFEDLAHFSKEFKKKFGYNPSDTYENAQIELFGS